MVRPQLPFCIPFKNDSLRFQRIMANTNFLTLAAASYKCDFRCSKLQLQKRFVSMNISRTEFALHTVDEKGFNQTVNAHWG